MRSTRSEFFVLAIITLDSVALSTSFRMESGCSLIMADIILYESNAIGEGNTQKQCRKRLCILLGVSGGLKAPNLGRFEALKNWKTGH